MFLPRVVAVDLQGSGLRDGRAMTQVTYVTTGADVFVVGFVTDHVRARFRAV